MTELEKQECVDELQRRSDAVLKHAAQIGGGPAAVVNALERELSKMLGGRVLLIPDRDDIVNRCKKLPPYKQYFPDG